MAEGQQFMKLAAHEVRRALVEGTAAWLALRQRDAFTRFDRMFVGTAMAPPQLWVMPERTLLAEEGSNVASVSDVSIHIAVQAPEPERAVEAALDYAWAVDQALRFPQIVWDVRVMRVFVQSHEYGALYQRGQAFMRYPEVKVAVQMQEAWQ